MEDPLHSLQQKQKIAIQLYGLPGTYKTTVLVQIIIKKLKEGYDRIYLIDNTGNFPIVRLKSIKHLLQNMLVFHPKTLEEEAILLDDFDILFLSEDSILLIDDVFRHTNLENEYNIHLNSYILAQVNAIAKRICFPVILTNQARSYDKNIQPFFHNLTLQYLDWHFFFEKSRNPNHILVTFFEKDRYVLQSEYKINSSGFIINF
ncbi:MAG: hypothetical protein ACFFB2_14085 [Promethearchaeota archaeon]